MRVVLGALVFSLPFIALFGWIAHVDGWRQALAAFAFTLAGVVVVLACCLGAAYLIVGAP